MLADYRLKPVLIQYITVRETLFGTMTSNGDFCINSSSKVKINGRFGKLIQFYIQNYPWKSYLMKNHGIYEGFKIIVPNTKMTKNNTQKKCKMLPNIHKKEHKRKLNISI